MRYLASHDSGSPVNKGTIILMLRKGLICPGEIR